MTKGKTSRNKETFIPRETRLEEKRRTGTAKKPKRTGPDSKNLEEMGKETRGRGR